MRVPVRAHAQRCPLAEDTSYSSAKSSGAESDAPAASLSDGELRAVEGTSVTKLRLSAASRSYNVLPFVYSDRPEREDQQPVIVTGSRHFDYDMAT